MKVLVVDDSGTIRKIVAEMLKTTAQVEMAENGAVGIEFLKKNPAVDIVLLDWNMPVLDGPGFLAQIKTVPQFTGSIIMMTTENSPEKIMSALEKGAKEYIMKPFTADVLIDKVNYVLEQRKAS